MMDDFHEDMERQHRIKRNRDMNFYYVCIVFGFFVGLIICSRITSYVYLNGIIPNENYELLKRINSEKSKKKFEIMSNLDSERRYFEGDGTNTYVYDYRVVLYSEWVKDWLLQGNEGETARGSGRSDNWLELSRIVIVDEGDILTPNYGWAAVTYFAPEGINFEIKDLGDNKLFYWDEDGRAVKEGCKTVIINAEVLRYLKELENEELEKVLKSRGFR